LAERVVVSNVLEDGGFTREDQGKLVRSAEAFFFIGHVCPHYAIRMTIATGMHSFSLESKNYFQVSK
jgi:hypothetical protein